MKNFFVFFNCLVFFHGYSQNTFLKKIGNTYSRPSILSTFETYNGNLVCVGEFDNNNNFNSGYISMSSPAGVELWTYTFGQNALLEHDVPIKALETPDSAILVICRSSHSNVNGHYTDGLYIIKYNSFGDTIFQKRYLGPFWGPHDVYQYNDGSLLLVLNTAENPMRPDSSMMHIVKLNIEGNLIWSKRSEE